MPPKRRPPQEPDPNQSAFIEVEVTGSGLTDPEGHRRIARIVGVRPEGILPDEAEPSEGYVTPETAATEALREATKTEHRRRGQLGKHSPLRRDGTYLSLRLGDVLPPNESLGRAKPVIVKERNYDAAKRYAAQLEELRLERIKRNPTLDTVRLPDVIQVVADGFDINSALEASQHVKRLKDDVDTDELPRFNTLSARLSVILDEAAQARFVLASKTEITVALPLLDRDEKGEEMSVGAAADKHIHETYQATQKVVTMKGYPKIVKDWYADRAVASRLYEMVDFYNDAVESGELLHDFVDIMKQLDSDEARQEFIASHYHPAMGVIMRHVVAHQLKDGDITEEDLFFKPLTTSEDRTYRTSELPTAQTKVAGRKLSNVELREAREMVIQQVKNGTGEFTDRHKTRRNKTLITPFTNPNMPAAVQEFIHKTFAEIPLDDLRKLIPVVGQKQWKREQFWYEAYHGIRPEYRALVTDAVATTNPHTLQ